MGINTNRLIKSLLGILLLCVFTLRPCAAFVQHVSTLKSLAAVDKEVEEPAKETKDSKDTKSRVFAEAALPAETSDHRAVFAPGPRRTMILAEVQGCSGPILRIHTPPPDLIPGF